MNLHRRLIVCLFVLVWVAAFATGSAIAQGGLRASLDLLDRDEDGYLDPEEITPLSRPYLEKIAQARRLSLDRPNRIDRLQEAARIYYAKLNGAVGESVRTSKERAIERFGTRDDEVVVPEFGLPFVKFEYIGDDLDEADDQLERYDRNRDGFIDRYESRRARWTHMDPFEMDLNKDDKLSRLELAQRYARRRLLSQDSRELYQRRERVGSEIRPSRQDDDDNRSSYRSRDSWSRRGGSDYWLTQSMLSRFDANQNGRLERSETISLGIPAGQIDANQDGELSREELFAFLSDMQDKSGEAAEGVPGWFYELDKNGDQQISLPEFAVELTDARVEEFVSIDTNRDGLLTTNEILTSKSLTGGTFENNEAEILPPKKTIVSEIEVAETFRIADLNVRLSITHTYASHLDAYLTGPDGQRIELFTAVGGSDDHFNGTVFDDQARAPINKSRAPFEGSYIPEGLLKRQPGLAAFNGKSVEGVWQLTIRCSRSDRFGMLHSWALIAKPDDDQPFDQQGDADEDVESRATPAVAAQLRSEPQPLVRVSRDDSRREASRKIDPANYWTPERKAEFAEKIRKPSGEEWDKLSDEDKRAKLEARKQAIQEYKRAYLEQVAQ